MASRIRVCKYTHAAPTDSKWDKMVSKFSKLLENGFFFMFCQILKFSKSYTKLLEIFWMQGNSIYLSIYVIKYNLNPFINKYNLDSVWFEIVQKWETRLEALSQVSRPCR